MPERLARSVPRPPLSAIAAAAGVSRSTLYRHFPSRATCSRRSDATAPREPGEQRGGSEPLPAGRLGRDRPVRSRASTSSTSCRPRCFPSSSSPRRSGSRTYPWRSTSLDIDGSPPAPGGRARTARSEDRVAAGDWAGARRRRPRRAARGACRQTGGRGLPAVAARPRDRGHPHLGATAATTGRDRATGRGRDRARRSLHRHFARGQRRKQPKAAAEIQQSLLPPRISRITGGEVAGNVLPSYDVGGDWFDIVENLDGVWITVADGLGAEHPCRRQQRGRARRPARQSAQRRSTTDALMLMHTTLGDAGSASGDARTRGAVGPGDVPPRSSTAGMSRRSSSALTASLRSSPRRPGAGSAGARARSPPSTPQPSNRVSGC